MNTTETSLTLLPLFLCSTPAQDYTKLGLPEGAKARLGQGRINDITYSPDGSRLVVAGSIGIWLYDTATLQEINLLTGHSGPVEGVMFTPDGSILASGSRDKTVRLWDARTGEHLRTLTLHMHSVEADVFSPDGSERPRAGEYPFGTVRLWNAVTGQPSARMGTRL